MLKYKDTAFFVFRGDFRTHRYNDFLCLPTNKRGFKYFPFYPVVINSTEESDQSYHRCCNISIGSVSSWNIPTELLEEEFSLVRFLVAKVTWSGEMTKEDYIILADAVRASSSTDRT